MTIGTANQKANTSATVDRAFVVLEALRDAREPLGVRDLARRVGTSPASVHRLLKSLQVRGFVTQPAGSRAYQLGWGLLTYASALLGRTDVVGVAAPIARNLRDRTAETVTVQVPDGSDRVCVYEAEGLHEVRRRVGVGRRVPLAAGASGRALLAFLPEDEVGELLAAAAPLTARTLTDAARLRALLAETRRTGIAASAGETVDGVASIAAPVFDSSAVVVASLAVSGPSIRCTPAVLAAFVPLLLEAAVELSARLGFQGGLDWTGATVAQLVHQGAAP